jgi:Fic family protein
MSPRVFRTPEPGAVELRVIELIGELRDRLQHRIAEPRRWLGSLRRMAFARAVQASNSIEGYDASLDDVAAAVDGETTLDADTETELALVGYRDAMTYVLQAGGDPTTEIDEGLIKSLHFMMIKHDLTKNPGRWRPGAVYVRREPSGEIVYEGPPADEVPGLMESMVAELDRGPAHPLVRAAMAHLNLVMIHPFSDGNGRMGRALQTLVLARDQIVAPAFSSIEEYLGRNTQAYYDVLAQVGQGSWHPERDARAWVDFCLTAHYRQGRTHLRRIEEAERLYASCTELARQHRVADRCAAGLYDAAHGFRLRNATYRAAVVYAEGEEISDLTASRDLKAMVDAGLLEPVGERRGRHYLARKPVTAIREEIRGARPPREQDDPFVLARDSLQMSLEA